MVRRRWGKLVESAEEVAARRVWLARNHSRFCRYLREHHQLAGAVPIWQAQWKHGTKFYRAHDPRGRPVFVKFDGEHKLLRNEIEAARRLRAAGAQTSRFAQMRFCDTRGEYRIAGFEWVEGKGILEADLSGVLDSHPSLIADDMAGILDDLYRAGLVHRDLIPRNLLACPAAGPAPLRLVLIDFAFATFSGVAAQDELVPLPLLAQMGGTYKPGPYVWDDAYAMAHIAGELAARYGLDLSVLQSPISARIGRTSYALNIEQELNRRCL